MQNSLLRVTCVFLLVSPLMALGEQPETIRLREYVISRGDTLDEVGVRVEKYKSEFQEASSQKMLKELLQKAATTPGELTETDKQAAVAALAILAAIKTNDAFNIATPLLSSSSPGIRHGASQLLAVAGGRDAARVLENVANNRMNFIEDSNSGGQREAVDLVRCALLAAPEKEREAMLKRLTQQMKSEIKDDPQKNQQIEAIFKEIKTQIDKAGPIL